MRYQFIDISKGMVIILMVIGHSGIPQFISNWIWSFHMPFFFFISGILTNWEIAKTKFTLTKCKSLLIPFCIYSLIIFMLYPLYGDMEIWQFIKHIARLGWGGYALWFIPVLLISLLICRLIPYKYHISSIITFSLIGGILSAEKIYLPWTLSTVPIACSYLLVGSHINNWIKYTYPNYKLPLHFVIFISGLTLTMVVGNYYKLDLATNQILPFIPLYCTSIAGLLMSLSFALIVKAKSKALCNLLSRIGTSTLEILALSQVIIFLINTYFPCNAIIKYALLSILLLIAVLIKKSILNALSERITLKENRNGFSK